MTQDVHQVFDHVWPSGSDERIALLRVPLEHFDAGQGLRLESWVEEGLGPVRGFWCQLPSGRIVMLSEYLATKGSVLHGVHLSVDSGEFRQYQVGQWIAELLAAFDLPPDAVLWATPPESPRQHS